MSKNDSKEIVPQDHWHKLVAVALKQAQQPLCSREVAVRTNCTKQTVTWHMQTLVDKKLATRDTIGRVGLS